MGAEFRWGPEAMQRAANAAAAARQAGDDDAATARRVVEALTGELPAANFAVGTLLQAVEMVILVNGAAGLPGAVVARGLPDDPDSFETVGHHVDLAFGHEDGRRWIKRVAVSKLTAPAPGPKQEGTDAA